MMGIKRMIETQANNLKTLLDMHALTDAQLQEIHRWMHCVVRIAGGGKGPEAEYPRYFVPNDARFYWYVLFPGRQAWIRYPNDGGGETLLTEENLEKAPGVDEVTREEAEAHIRGKPEKCVWTWSILHEGYRAGCTAEVFDERYAKKFHGCPYCILPIELRDLKNDETPDGHREPEEWEKECAEPPDGTWCQLETAYTRWHLDFWPPTCRTIVPADWTPLPPCRDCGGKTKIQDGGDRGQLYYVRCDITPGYCTTGPLKSTKAEAVKAYPRGGE